MSRADQIFLDLMMERKSAEEIRDHAVDLRNSAKTQDDVDVAERLSVLANRMP